MIHDVAVAIRRMHSDFDEIRTAMTVDVANVHPATALPQSLRAVRCSQ